MSILLRELRKVAEARNKVFVHMKRNRPLSKNYEEVGLLGEWEFAKFSGIMMRTEPGGDGGIDFEIPVVLTVDVKTSRKGDKLLVESGKVKADIYVLAHYANGEGDEPAVTLLGWCSAVRIKSIEPVDSGRGVINHEVEVGELRPMEELRAMIGSVRR